MFTARAATRRTVTAESIDSAAINALAGRVSGITSVGPNAVAFVSDTGNRTAAVELRESKAAVELPESKTERDRAGEPRGGAPETGAASRDVNR